MNWIAAGVFLAMAAAPALAAPRFEAPKPIEVKEARSYDFTSGINGRTYRLFVHVPAGTPPAQGFPVVYVLDGNTHFSTALDAARAQALFQEVRPAVIVGIGYASDDIFEILKVRNKDLTTPITAQGLARMPPNPGLTVENAGGLDLFLKVIEGEVKPFVGTLTKVDKTDQTLFGHSLGGLAVVRALFTEPTAFRTFIAASPSLFWNDRAVLADEAAFSEAVRSGAVRPRILLEAGALEGSPTGYRTGGVPMTQDQVNALIDTTRMVENPRSLGERLASLKGAPGYRVETVIFSDESHLSVMPAAISRAINFALSVDGDSLPKRLPAGSTPPGT